MRRTSGNYATLTCCSWSTLVSPMFVQQCVTAQARPKIFGSVVQPVGSMARGTTEGNFDSFNLVLCIYKHREQPNLETI